MRRAGPKRRLVLPGGCDQRLHLVSAHERGAGVARPDAPEHGRRRDALAVHGQAGAELLELTQHQHRLACGHVQPGAVVAKNRQLGDVAVLVHQVELGAAGLAQQVPADGAAMGEGVAGHGPDHLPRIGEAPGAAGGWQKRSVPGSSRGAECRLVCAWRQSRYSAGAQSRASRGSSRLKALSGDLGERLGPCAEAAALGFAGLAAGCGGAAAALAAGAPAETARVGWREAGNLNPRRHPLCGRGIYRGHGFHNGGICNGRFRGGMAIERAGLCRSLSAGNHRRVCPPPRRRGRCPRRAQGHP